MGMNFHWNNDHSHGASFHFLLKLPQLHCCLSSSDGIPIPIGNPIPIISLIQANLYGVMFQHSSIFCGIPVLVDLDSIKNLLEKTARSKSMASKFKSFHFKSESESRSGKNGLVSRLKYSSSVRAH